jgi:hypothetical protein
MRVIYISHAYLARMLFAESDAASVILTRQDWLLQGGLLSLRDTIELSFDYLQPMHSATRDHRYLSPILRFIACKAISQSCQAVSRLQDLLRHLALPRTAVGLYG